MKIALIGDPTKTPRWRAIKQALLGAIGAQRDIFHNGRMYRQINLSRRFTPNNLHKVCVYLCIFVYVNEKEKYTSALTASKGLNGDTGK